MKLLVIGGGNMGHTYALSIKAAMKKMDIAILEAYPPKVEQLKAENIFNIYTNVEAGLKGRDIVMLAVKPQHSDALFKNMKPYIDPNTLVISIMAGVKIDTISAALDTLKVARAMPNLPAQVGKGMTAFCTSPSIDQHESELIKNILNSTGVAITVDNENDIDASTGISGSGPAYVFYFMQAMMQAAEKLGFSTDEAKVLVTQTFEGAVQLFKKNDLTTMEWMNRVASKGGTTRAALDSFEANNLGTKIIEGAVAAYDRAVELGKE
ncbi:MAG: pyrroline-5-carboxylate reductase [Saprospiraceae bacterium]